MGYENNLKWDIIPMPVKKYTDFKYSGVYMIAIKSAEYPDDKILYIGSALNIGKRFMGHMILKHLISTTEPPKQVVVYIHKKSKNFREVESRLISELHPPLNKSHNHKNTQDHSSPFWGRKSCWVVGKLNERGIKMDEASFSIKKKLDSFTDQERLIISELLGVTI